MAERFLWLAVLVMLANHCSCHLPRDLSNFQNEYVCNSDVRLVRPLTVMDVEKATRLHGRVKAVGTGYSWNKLYCAPSPSTGDRRRKTSANIAMTTIRPLKIEVNEEEPSVWVSAGVIVYDLMLYLANYITSEAPRGYTLLTVAGFVNQTVAGAIATGSHGSSLRHGSMSNQVLAVRAVLANGTAVEISQESHPFLIKAFRINVGRLGVVTDVKLRIHPERIARRILRSAVPDDVLIEMLRNAVKTYNETGDFPDWIEGASIIWLSQNSTSEIYSFEVLEDSDEGTAPGRSHQPNEDSTSFLDEVLMTRINAPVNVSRSAEFSKIAEGVRWERPMPIPPNLAIMDPNITSASEAAIAAVVRANWNNASVEEHEAPYVLLQTQLEGVTMTLLDDYSIGVPARKMVGCFEGIRSILKSTKPDNGLRQSAFLRFVGKEDALLSASYSEPQLRIDLFDYVYYNQPNRTSNVPFKELMAFIVTSPRCSPARLHWGKAGWPDSGCWNGADFYKETWCDFGCAVLELDPSGKFIGGDPNLWNWNGANLEKCCTPDGYHTSLEECKCNVIPVRTPDECPKAPFFTNR